MTTLSKGANIAIPATTLRVTLTWASGPDLDLSGLLVGESGKVHSDDDFVFYNQPAHATGAVAHTGKTGTVDSLSIDLAKVPAEVARIVLAASADGGTFGQVSGLSVAVADAGTTAELATFAEMGATTETAFVLGELYRREGAWKFRAVGQGWATGLAGLATDYGITVDEPAAPVPAPPAVPPAPPAPPAVPAAPAPPAVAPGAVPPPPPSAYPPPPPLAPMSPGSAVPPLRPTPPAPAQPAPAVPATPAPATPASLDAGKVSLVKGQKVSLVKGGASLAAVTMGLGWDPARRGRSIDLDASVLAYDAAGNAADIIYFGHKVGLGGAIQHSGDNLTGEGEGDDEQIRVALDRIPPHVVALVFVITSYSGQKFTEISRAYCRLVDERTGAETVRYDLTNSEPSTAAVMAALTRGPSGTWEMKAVGLFAEGKTARQLVGPGLRALSR